jgi:hypothetical protein
MRKSLPKNQMKVHSMFLLIVAVFVTIPALSATYYSRQSGNWNDVNSWSLIGFGGAAAANIPGPGDDVVIDRSYIMLENVQATVSSVLIKNTSAVGGTSAQLLIENGRKLTVTGNFDVVAENIAKDNILYLKNDFTELEILGDLTFTRTVDNNQTSKNKFLLYHTSKVTVHGNYVVNNLSGATYLSQSDISLANNAQFICKSDVIWTINGLGNYGMYPGGRSIIQIDGDFTVNHNGEGRFTLRTYGGGQILVGQDLDLNVTSSGKCVLKADSGSPFTFGNLIHVDGDLNIDHPDGQSFGMEADYNGEIRVNGDMNVSWTGSTQITQTPSFYFLLTYDGVVNIAKSLNINMNEPNAALLFDLMRDAKVNVGTNNGYLQESATINILNGASMQVILDTRAELNVYGDFINNINIIDDLRFELNPGMFRSNVGKTKIQVDGNWEITKTGGDAFVLITEDASDVIVGGNFTVNSTNHEQGNFEDEEITIDNFSLFEVGGNFEYNMDDANQNINLNVNLSNDASRKTVTNQNDST